MDTNTLLQIARETVAKVTWCFVATANPSGPPNARIVRPGPLQKDWSIGFMTARTCRKAKEIELAGQFTMAFQDNSERAYVALQGKAQVISDAGIKRAVWSPESQRFHPGGPGDPNVVIIRLVTDRIELYNAERKVQPEPIGLCSVALVNSPQGWLQTFTSPKGAA